MRRRLSGGGGKEPAGARCSTERIPALRGPRCAPGRCARGSLGGGRARESLPLPPPRGVSPAGGGEAGGRRQPPSGSGAVVRAPGNLRCRRANRAAGAGSRPASAPAPLGATAPGPGGFAAGEFESGGPRQPLPRQPPLGFLCWCFLFPTPPAFLFSPQFCFNSGSLGGFFFSPPQHFNSATAPPLRAEERPRWCDPPFKTKLSKVSPKF